VLFLISLRFAISHFVCKVNAFIPYIVILSAFYRSSSLIEGNPISPILVTWSQFAFREDFFLLHVFIHTKQDQSTNRISESRIGHPNRLRHLSLSFLHSSVTRSPFRSASFIVFSSILISSLQSYYFYSNCYSVKNNILQLSSNYFLYNLCF